MGMLFSVGETKKRPGTYQRYENIGKTSGSDTYNGIATAVITADWGPLGTPGSGPLGKVISMSDDSEISKYFGSAGTTKVLHELFTGGASTVIAVRAGSGGTAGSITLKDAGDTPAEAITITLKYPGSRKFQCLLRDSLTDESKREFILYEDSSMIEKITFALSTNGEVDALVAAGADSNYLLFKKADKYSGNGKLAAVPQTNITPGTDPTVTNESYSDALSLLEGYRFNTICLDTNDPSVHALLQGFVDRIFNDGKMCFGVVGEPISIDYTTRLAHSAAYNDYKIIYLGTGWIDSDGDVHDGYYGAARIAGMVAAVASNATLTHKKIAGAVSPAEMLTNSQLDAAVDHGMMALSVNSSDAVWIDYAITTLNAPLGEDDSGWKKIRRVKTRYELLQRCSNATENLRVDNNTDGSTAVKQAVQGVLNAMVSEGKLSSGATVSSDSSNKATGDSAWFIIQADDIDSLEKIYEVFQFRFSASTSSTT